MQELQAGNKTALDVIMQRWELPIKAYIYRFTQAPDWVDELAQETFVKVYIHASEFDTHRRFSPWIYTIATNLCRNWRRWRMRHPSLPSEHSAEVLEQDPLGTSQATASLPSEQLEDRESREAVKHAIAELPDALKTTLILYYYQGLSYEEIGEMLHCSRRGVETRLYRARRLLQPRLAKWARVG
jgi:RNA polymerase sigma-70 factor (ECF subfamily)